MDFIVDMVVAISASAVFLIGFMVVCLLMAGAFLIFTRLGRLMGLSWIMGKCGCRFKNKNKIFLRKRA